MICTEGHDQPCVCVLKDPALYRARIASRAQYWWPRLVVRDRATGARRATTLADAIGYAVATVPNPGRLPRPELTPEEVRAAEPTRPIVRRIEGEETA